MSFQNHNDRREAAEAAKKAMLEKFKNKTPVEVDAATVAQRAAEQKAREEKRVAAEQKRRERVELEKIERKIAAEAAKKAEEDRIANEAIAKAQRKRAEAEAAELRRFEEEARRDLAMASRRTARK